MITGTADVLKGIKALWDRNGTLRALVPGDLHHRSVPQTVGGSDTKFPYASITVTEGEKELTSGKDYTQAFDVNVRVWSGPQVPDAGAITQQMHATISQEIRAQLQIRGAVNVMEVRTLAGALEEDPQTRESKDVLVATANWQIWLHLRRP